MAGKRGRPATPTTALVQASARGETALDDVEAVLNYEGVEVFARAVGGRDQLADVLAIAAGPGSEIAKITTYLLDPRYRSWSLARLCHMTGITVAELFAAYKKALITRAHIEATHTIAAKLPAVVVDVMDKALSDPTVERHKLALEIGQLIEKKGGLLIQQNNVAATAGGVATGSLEQLQQAVGDLLFGGRRDEEPLDVEATPAELPDDDDPDDDDVEVNRSPEP